MNRTRLFINKVQQLKNSSFNHKSASNGGYWDEWWEYPIGTQFNQYGLVPLPVDINGRAGSVTQDLGITEAGKYEVTMVLDGDPDNHSGIITLTIGDPNYMSLNVYGYNPGVVKQEFEVTQPDPVFGWKVVISAGYGSPIPSPLVNLGLKSVYVRKLSAVNWKEVDLYSDVEIPITYNVADIRDISKKNSAYSLDFDIPNTQNNAVLFDHIGEISVSNNIFALDEKYEAFLETDGVRTFNCYLKLSEVTINDNKEISYNANLHSSITDLWDILGTTTLRGNQNANDDLDFSGYSKTLTANEIFMRTDMHLWDTSTDPWSVIGTKTYGKDFQISLVDRTNLGLNPVTPDKKHIYVDFFQLTPFLFVKEIWDKIFEWAGYSYVSEFLNNTPNNTTEFAFDHIAYPALNLNNKEDVIQHSYVEQILSYSPISAYNSSVNAIFTQNNNPYPFDVLVGNPVCYSNANNALMIGQTTPLASFSPNWTFTATSGGLYRIKCNIPLDFMLNLTDIFGTAVSDTGNVSFDSNQQWRVKFQIIRYNVVTSSETIIEEYDSGMVDYESSYFASNGVINLPSVLFDKEIETYMRSGDRLYFKMYYLFPVGGMNGGVYDTVARFGGLSRFFNFTSLLRKTNIGSKQVDVTLSSTFYVDGYFDPTYILDRNEKKTDFLLNYIKKFNLYIEDVTDKRDKNGTYYRDYVGVRRGERILRIEPYDMFYTDKVKDFTSNVDTDTLRFCRTSDIITKKLTFKDKNDETYLVKDYNSYNYIEGEYGEKIVYSQQNTSDDDKTEINTELGETMVTPIKEIWGNWLQTASIFSLDDSGQVKSDKNYNSRGLFVYDVMKTDFQDVYYSSTIKGFVIRDANNIVIQYSDQYGTMQNIETFNRLDHLNSPYGTDTADINFGWANWYYQNLGSSEWVTDNNCYNAFYNEYVTSSNDEASRMLTCNMYLDPCEISELQCSDLIIVNNIAYRINKIEGWKNKNTPVKVELIKITQSKSVPPAIPINPKHTNNIVTPLSVQTEMTSLLASQNEIIVKMQATMKTMNERIKKLEEGGSDGGGTTGEDGKEENKEDYD